MTIDALGALPRGIEAPADTIPHPPVETRSMSLPFGELTWENFERLCYRLAKLSGTVEYCARYGVQGEAQEGIDIFARTEGGVYECWQAKRHKRFGPSHLKAAVALFEGGEWAAKSKRFVVAVQASMRTTAAQKEIERLALRLKKKGIAFELWDGEELTERLRSHPELIDDFFGRPWVAVIFGQDRARAFDRLDGGEFARVRKQLGQVYSAQFHHLDPGSFGSLSDDGVKPALAILERFTLPDLIIREQGRERVEEERAPVEALPLLSELPKRRGQLLRGRGARPVQSQTRRFPLNEWFASGDNFIVTAEAGFGKSTLLRAIALDLLEDQQVFPALARRWGGHLPLHISFAAWTREVAKGSAIGVKEIVRRSLQPHLTANIDGLIDRAIDEKRVLLLIDGLDEWSEEQPARTALTALVTAIGAHNIPAIVTGRPRGMTRIGTLPSPWKRAAIAPLSRDQQAVIAERWFARYAPTVMHAEASDTVSPARARVFLGELGRDRNLSVLAETPLLLVGLILLSLNGRVLPRNRVEAYGELVNVMLDHHPVARATAAGDVVPRFRHAYDPILRRAAIAFLAFNIRKLGGGSALAVDDAQDLLSEFIARPEEFDLNRGKAKAAVAEILAVNAETQGILIEKSPGEVGFAHASFEEFLGAEYLHSRPFDDVLAFVEEQAGEPRWRNVITNLLAMTTRRNEFDALVAAIEQPDADPLAAQYREGLLAEVAFGSSGRFPSTGRRLADRAFMEIEFGDWLPLRQDALRAALGAIGDPNLASLIDERLLAWAPLRQEDRSDIIDALAAGPPMPDVEHILWFALHDHDRGTQRAAARAYSGWFKGQADAADRLLDGLKRTPRPHVAAAFLESLVLGWPEHDNLSNLLAEAYRSSHPLLRLVAISGLAARGEGTTAMRDELVLLMGFWSGLDYADRPLALYCLLKFWLDDETLVAGALSRLGSDRQSPWEYDYAKTYILHCSSSNPDIRRWIMRVFTERGHFPTMGTRDSWSHIGRFAKEDEEIREKAIEIWGDKKARLLDLHELHNFVVYIRDDRLRTIAADIVKGPVEFGQYWAFRALLAGWGMDHPEVTALGAEIWNWPDDRLVNLVAFLPFIEPDAQKCRERLLALSQREDVRRDLLGIAFEELGADPGDDEAVAAMLAPTRFGAGVSATSILLRSYAAHHLVQDFVHERLMAKYPPLGQIARSLEHFPDLRAPLLRACAPLPLELRSDIAEAAIAGGVATTLGATLARYPQEQDSELKVRMSIGHHEMLKGDMEQEAAAIPLIEAEIVGYGTGMEADRAAALAGFAILDRLDHLAALLERGKPVNLSVGSYVYEIPAITRLICKYWDKFRAAYGAELEERFQVLSDNKFPAILADGALLSDAARAEFLASADDGTMRPTPAALRTLAAIRPGSPLLRQHCLDALGKGDIGNQNASVCAEIALLLAAEFPGDPIVLEALDVPSARFADASRILALGVYSPGHSSLEHFKEDIFEPLQQFGGWAANAHVAAACAEPPRFADFVAALVGRQYYSEFDAQPFANIAIEARLRRDGEAAECLAGLIRLEASSNILASIPRFLAAAGLMNDMMRAKVLDILSTLTHRQVVPLAGYDAIADGIRSVRLSLLDALHVGSEI